MPASSGRPISLQERLATACVSAALMAVTIAIVVAGLVFVNAFISMTRPDRAGVAVGVMMFYGPFTLTVTAVLVGLAAIVGFALGSERMARVFGVIWGTEAAFGVGRDAPKVIVLLLVTVMIVFFALRTAGVL